MLTGPELKTRLRSRIILTLIKALPEAVSGSNLRKKCEYYLRGLRYTELDFMNFLDKLEDNQEIIRVVKNMKMYYELFNKEESVSILAENRTAKNLTHKVTLERNYPELYASAMLLKKQREHFATVNVPITNTEVKIAYDVNKLSPDLSDSDGFGISVPSKDKAVK